MNLPGKIVVAGCGEMGLPMLKCLVDSGFDASGFDVLPPAHFQKDASRMIEDFDGLRGFDTMITVVRDQHETEALLFDDQAVFQGKPHPRCLIICSTLSPRYIRQLSDRLPHEVRLIDAPMSGASHGAEAGTLSFMLGGDRAVVDNLMPVFSAMGSSLVYAGSLGSGMTLKVLNNYVTASSVAAVRRVIDMADALGVEQNLLLEVMRSSSGATWYADQFEQIEWANHGYESENTIGILEKDVRATLDAVADLSAIEASPLDQAVLRCLKLLKAR